MTIEKKSYFERRIRPIIDENEKQDYNVNKPQQQEQLNHHHQQQQLNHDHNHNHYHHYQHQQQQQIPSPPPQYFNLNPHNLQSRKPSSSNGGIIDEEQLERTFQEIVNSINLDDDEDESDGESSFLSKIKDENNLACSGNQTSSTGLTGSNNFSRSNYHHSHHSLIPEFNSIFGSTKTSFNVAVGSGSGSNTPSSNSNSNSNSSSSSSTSSIEVKPGKSFLDDDWFPRTRPMTPISSISNGSGSSVSSNSTSISNSSNSSPNSLLSSSSSVYRAPIPPPGLSSQSGSSSSSSAGFTSFMSSPPGDYVCKLCSYGGHWMKDCKLYEPRNMIASSSSSTLSNSSFASFKSSASNLSTCSNSCSSGGGGANRSVLPPGNYVCRLCNVAGHWIDQCSKFQPKHETGNSSNNSVISTVTLPPMLGPGPTPNYRPPAYLSKPVPSNYICNLCNRPGHWIQQCSEFTPIINHKPKW